LDGLKKDEKFKNMLIIAATNLEDQLDPAMTRAGRFDKIIRMSSPDMENRKKLIQYYLDKVSPLLSDQKTIARDDIKIHPFASRTSGWSGAQIANFVNLAALNAVKKKSTEVSQEDLEYSFDR
jgi:ATP-dependent Zn protease